jgi:hypothetical protein
MCRVDPGEFTIRELAQSIIDLTGSSSQILRMPYRRMNPSRGDRP